MSQAVTFTQLFAEVNLNWRFAGEALQLMWWS